MEANRSKSLWGWIAGVGGSIIAAVVAVIIIQSILAPEPTSLPNGGILAGQQPAPTDEQLRSQPPPTTTGLKVGSDPAGADTYLNWKLEGKTPVWLEGKKIKGLLVVIKEGHRAGFRQIDSQGGGEIKLALLPDITRPRTRALLVISDGGSDEAFSSVRTSLAKQGFMILGQEDTKVLQSELYRAGGLSHKGLRAWARVRFDTDLVLSASLRHSSRKLSEQEFGFTGIREAVKGAVRTEVSIDLYLIDLSSGEYLASVSGTGVSFALDPDHSFEKAVNQAANESAKLLQERING